MVRWNKPLLQPLVVCLLILSAAIVHSDDLSNLYFVQGIRSGQDLPDPSAKSPLDLKDESNELKMAGLAFLRLYQVVLSSQDGPRCMFHPSCSEYAKLALSEHGAIIGSLMTIDRYLRCNGSDRELYPYDPIRRKLLDPVPDRAGRSETQ
ncbi:MAG: membrane protein insertion efficiency factor YidD [Spirochaetaceae bacterium]|nr:MAG: membrane protein insertion efficiency factor YidD [Spirochaetaceae bacterium]